MPLPLEEVGLREELVALDYRASLGFGHAYGDRGESGSDRTEYLFAAASSFRRAGASALLLGRRNEMISAFRNAERLYSALHSSEAAMMVALRTDRPLSLNDYPQFGDTNIRTLDDEARAKHVYSLLTILRYEPIDQLRIETLLELLQTSYFSGSSVGLLGIPTDSYVNLCLSLYYYRQSNVSQIPIEIALAPFVTAYDSAIVTASKNVSHWSLLVQIVHPAEPDLIGLLSMVHLALDPAILPRVLPQLPMSRICRTLLLGCMETRFPDDFGHKVQEKRLLER